MMSYDRQQIERDIRRKTKEFDEAYDKAKACVRSRFQELRGFIDTTEADCLRWIDDLSQNNIFSTGLCEIEQDGLQPDWARLERLSREPVPHEVGLSDEAIHEAKRVILEAGNITNKYPLKLKAKLKGFNTVELLWDAAQSATSYRAEMKKSSSKLFNKIYEGREPFFYYK